MGRALRIDVGGEIYHVLNRANARMTIFEKDNDYQVFEAITVTKIAEGLGISIDDLIK